MASSFPENIFPSPFRALHEMSHIVAAEHHILGRDRDRLSARGFQKIFGRKHDFSRFPPGLFRKRNMNRHLVAVEISVESGADHRMNLDGFPFNQHRLESLDTQAMKGWSAVEKDISDVQ